jgi:hypothetical protein
MPSRSPAPPAIPPASSDGPAAREDHSFDFLAGDWRVRHRKLSGRLCGETRWLEFEGRCRGASLLDGTASVDENWLADPAGAYRALTVRRRDAATGRWSIWWFDERVEALGPPVHGRFVDRVGTFLGDDVWHGRPIRVRFLWHVDGPDALRWEQAFSDDGGGCWETNWTMRFERAPWT